MRAQILMSAKTKAKTTKMAPKQMRIRIAKVREREHCSKSISIAQIKVGKDSEPNRHSFIASLNRLTARVRVRARAMAQ